MSLYVRINRSIQDPIFRFDNFWHLPSKLIHEVVTELIEQDKAVVNSNSVTAAHMVESLRAIASSMGGNKKYEYNPSIFLPYPPDSKQEKTEKIKEFTLNRETTNLFLSELDAGRVPRWVVAGLTPYILEWKKNER